MLSFPTLTDEKTGEDFFTIRRVDEIDDFIEVEINTAISLLAPQFILEKIAELVYTDSFKYYVIVEQNELKHPGEWQPGDVLKIPNVNKVPQELLETKRQFSLI